MGPKKSDNINKGHRPSLLSTEDQENQQCSGKFSSDVDLCCRTGYPVNIPVVIRGRPPTSSLVNPPLTTIDEQQTQANPKRPSRGRIPSISQSGPLINADNDNKSNSMIFGQDSFRATTNTYRTFHLIRDTEYYRPKLSVDLTANETESIEQIQTLYMKAWQLDQLFLDQLKKILPLQEHLHTLNFSFVGLNEQTIIGLADLCQSIKNLKTLSLDGNPLAANHFHVFLEREDLKIANLSLRFCKITDGNAERLAHYLGNMSTQNWKLLTLTLTGNQIGDNGAKSFAKALRYNRTLISLNLSSNFITDKGACALALVLRKIVLTQEELIQRRYLFSERLAETQSDEMRNTSSPTLSIGSITRSGKRTSDTHKRRKSISKSTDKRHRAESGDEIRPPSATKGDGKKSKADGATARSSSINPRRSAATANTNEQARPTTAARGKKTTASSSSLRKNISAVKEEDEDVIEEDRSARISLSAGRLMALQIQHTERENPLLELTEIENLKGEISLKGNFVVLSLNLSRNYLTMTSVNEFLQTVQTQMNYSHFNDSSSLSSTTVSLVEFSGLSRLELKGMNGIQTKSSIYQALENLLNQKNPLHRIQQIKERDAKDLFDQQPSQTSQQTLVEKTRPTASVKSLNQRPTSRMKD